MRDAEKTVGNMIDKEKTIFVGSVDAEGFPNIKAMLQTRKREGLKHIYLSTNTSSMRVSQFLKNNRACLYVCNTRFFKGVMLRGTMEILTDSTSKEMIWQEGDTMYYPEGVTDPDYCVLKFTAFSGRWLLTIFLRSVPFKINNIMIEERLNHYIISGLYLLFHIRF